MKTKLPVLAAALLSTATLPHLLAEVTITQHPADQIVSLNAHVTLAVIASSTAPPITYQWYGKGALLPDQTSRTLVLNNIQLDQAGQYYVAVNDADNQPVQSNPATVTVDRTFVKITEGAIVTDIEPSHGSVWWDYDGDGFLDVLVHLVGLPHGSAGSVQSFYRNQGDGTFLKITTNAVALSPRNGLGAAVGDYDNDGDQDVYLTSGHLVTGTPLDDLFRNDGNGRFTALVGQPWRQDRDFSFDCSFVDVDQDGLLDVYVNNSYWTDPGQKPCIYRQTVSGTFVKMTAVEGGALLDDTLVSDNGVWVDADNDGDPDLWRVDYRGGSRLYLNDGRGFFTLAPSTVLQQSPGNKGLWADFDNDGEPELFVGGGGWIGSQSVQGPNALYRPIAEGLDFTDVAPETGLAVTMAGWASAVGDYDNDGWLDILVADCLFGEGAASYPNVLFHNRGDGTFEQIDVGSPVRDGDNRIEVRFVDYDNDGFPDLFMVCGSDYARLNHLYRNNLAATGNANHWLKVKLNGQAANRSGIGAKIRVKATIGGREIWQLRELTGNGYSQTCPGLIAHFGLGDATQADIIRVEWPSSNVQELAGRPVDQVLTVTEQVMITPVRPSSSLGGSVTLTAQLNGTWQWYHDGEALDGQTAKTLTLSNIQATDAGRYSVAVTTATGTYTNHVYLLVDTRFEKITTGDVVNDGMRSSQGVWGDYDGDGHLDLAVVGGYWDSSGAVNSALYRNDGAGNLVKVADSPLSLSTDRCAYLAWADYDNDGDLDLATGVHEYALTALYLNQGNGQFLKQRTTADWIANGINVRGSTVGWNDYDADGLLDLMVINWVAGGGPPGPNSLLRNVGNGRFEVVTGSALALSGTSEETVAWIDFDGDGDLDFSSVEGASGLLRRLFRNLGNGAFEPLADSPFWGERGDFYWGHVWGDIDNDGDFDAIVCLGGADAGRDVVFLNDGQGNLTRADLSTLGLPADFGSLPALGDYDNDGYLDLFCSRGEGSRNRLFHNRGDGTFEEILMGSIPNYAGHSYLAAWADYDGDGYLDLFVPNDFRENNLLYRNNHRDFLAQMGQTNHWLQINLRGTKSNRSGIGAKVRVTATIGGKVVRQLRQIGGQTCAPELFAHFGLGDAPRATTVRVEWPSGTVEEFSNLAHDQFYTIVEPSMRGAIKPNGEFELSVWASTNRTCRIEHSPNLVNWTILATVTGQGETPVSYIDTDAPGQVHRFYRMR
jgi:enediyne biosynthesis protein E4